MNESETDASEAQCEICGRVMPWQFRCTSVTCNRIRDIEERLAKVERRITGVETPGLEGV